LTITYSSTSSQVQAGTTTIVLRQPASLSAGDLIIWLCTNKYPTAGPATPTGGFSSVIQKLGGSGAAGADVGEVYGTAFQLVSDGTEDGATQTVAITGGNTAVARAVSFARSAGTGWLVAATAGSQASGSNSWSVVGDASLDLAAGDVVLIYIAKNEDNDTNLSAHAITASGITFGAWNSITAHEGTTGGQDCAQAIGYFNVTAGSATVTPTFTMSTAGSANTPAGAVLFIRLREDGAGPTPIDFTGTIPTLTGAQGSAFSEDLSGYFAGSETPFAYTLQAGTLPAGLSLGSGTGIISGTPTVGGVHSGLVIRGTDDAANTDDSNSFKISLSSNPTTDVGYYALAQTNEDALQHTTASHSFHHGGKWWTFLPVSTDWNLYEESGNTPGSPGGTVDWVGSAHLTSVVTAQAQMSVCLDAANDMAYVVGYGSGGTVEFHALLYSGGSWTVDQSTNLTGTGGVGLGTSSTFESNIMLSVGVDSNGCPMVVAGNKGAGSSPANGVHIAWPNGGAASINGLWTSATIDSALTTTIDESGRFAGVFSQGGTDYVAVCYTDHTNERTRLAYHEVETTLADYATGWTLVTIDSTVSVDNHVWAGVMNYGGDQVVVTIIKAGDGAKAGRIYVLTSKLEAALTWTHKIHRVTGGAGEPGALEEAPSRPCGVLDETNGEVWVFYHTADSHPYEWIGYKKALLADLLAASAEGDVFDFAVAENGIPAINDETYNAAWNVKTPAHPIDSSMGYFPITGTVLSNSTTGDSVWWQKYAIAGAATFNPAWARGANTIIGARA
jgi:hypothetical protein